MKINNFLFLFLAFLRVLLFEVYAVENVCDYPRLTLWGNQYKEYADCIQVHEGAPLPACLCEDSITSIHTLFPSLSDACNATQDKSLQNAFSHRKHLYSTVPADLLVCEKKCYASYASFVFAKTKLDLCISTDQNVCDCQDFLNSLDEASSATMRNCPQEPAIYGSVQVSSITLAALSESYDDMFLYYCGNVSCSYDLVSSLSTQINEFHACTGFPSLQKEAMSICKCDTNSLATHLSLTDQGNNCSNSRSITAKNAWKGAVKDFYVTYPLEKLLCQTECGAELQKTFAISMDYMHCFLGNQKSLCTSCHDLYKASNHSFFVLKDKCEAFIDDINYKELYGTFVLSFGLLMAYIADCPTSVYTVESLMALGSSSANSVFANMYLYIVVGMIGLLFV